MNKYFIVCGVFLILIAMDLYKFGYNDALLEISEKSLKNVKSLESVEDTPRFLESLKCSSLALDMIK